jgi:hypothetical protein
MEDDGKASPFKVERPANDPLGYLIIPIFALLLVAAIILWFNQDPEVEKQKLFPVSGRVTLNGEPLSGSFQINFYPIEADNMVASAFLEDDGTYSLSSGQNGLVGAEPGNYLVSLKMLEGPEETWRISNNDPSKIKINPVDGGTIVPDDPDPPFDKIYTDIKDSPQRAIVSETTNVIDFDLD